MTRYREFTAVAALLERTGATTLLLTTSICFVVSRSGSRWLLRDRAVSMSTHTPQVVSCSHCRDLKLAGRCRADVSPRGHRWA